MHTGSEESLPVEERGGMYASGIRPSSPKNLLQRNYVDYEQKLSKIAKKVLSGKNKEFMKELLLEAINVVRSSSTSPT